MFFRDAYADRPDLELRAMIEEAEAALRKHDARQTET
jgi:hypothetical protein